MARKRFIPWILCVPALFALPGCDDITSPPLAAGVRVELEVSGGIAGVDFGFEVLGGQRVVRGLYCNNGCDFEAGEVLLPLSVVQIRSLAEDMEATGILELNGTDFGARCCDDFHYVLSYASGTRVSAVEGDGQQLPADMARIVGRLRAMARGTVPAVMDLEGRLDLPTDGLAIDDVTLNGNVLDVDLSYGGGCARHEIDLALVNGWLESDPVQVHGFLSHEDHDDPCDALITETRSFDLEPVATAYREAYGTAPSGATTVIIVISDPTHPEGSRRVEYVF